MYFSNNDKIHTKETTIKWNFKFHLYRKNMFYFGGTNKGIPFLISMKCIFGCSWKYLTYKVTSLFPKCIPQVDIPKQVQVSCLFVKETKLGLRHSIKLMLYRSLVRLHWQYSLDWKSQFIFLTCIPFQISGFQLYCSCTWHVTSLQVFWEL